MIKIKGESIMSYMDSFDINDLSRCDICTKAQKVVGDNKDLTRIENGVYYHYHEYAHCCNDKLVISVGQDHRCRVCGPYIPENP